MKRELILLIFLSLCFTCGAQAEELSLTLDEAVAIALRDNLDVALKTGEIMRAKAALQGAHAPLLPAVSFTGTWSKTNGYYSKGISQDTVQFSAKQYLYKGGSIINTIKYNQYGMKVAEAVLDKTKLEVAASVQKAFFTLLLAEEYAVLNKEIFENSREHFDLLQIRYQSGEAAESDLLALESSLAQVKEAYEASLNQRESAVELLKNILYLDQEVEIKAEGDFAYSPDEIAYDQAFIRALSLRPEIRQYEMTQLQAKSSIEIAKAATRPSIYASWDYYGRSHLVGLGGLTRNRNDHNVIGLNFSWPIFDGWAAKAKVEEALVDLKEAQLMREKTVKDIALELKNSYLALKNALSAIDTADAELALYADQRLIVTEKYAQGLMSLLDKSDAQLSYNVALFKKKEALYDYLKARIDFEQAQGGSA